MSLNLNLQDIDTEIVDKVGGKAYSLPTDVYDAEVTLAYLISSSSSKSRGIDITLKINNEEKSFQLYYTNKNNEPYYLDKDKNKKALPDLLVLSGLTKITLGKSIDNLSSNDLTKKTIKAWNSEAKKELPKEVEVIQSLIGKKVKVAIEEIEQNKYSDPSKTERKNKIVKFFNEKGYTANELENLKDNSSLQPEFIQKWLEVHKDKLTIKVDKTKLTSSSSSQAKSVTELNLDDEEL